MHVRLPVHWYALSEHPPLVSEPYPLPPNAIGSQNWYAVVARRWSPQPPAAQAVPPDVRQQLVSARAMALEVLVEEEVLGTTTIA